ncbi:MAG: sugar ABC transporter permease [Bacilli bacterium]|nr:sugar ABC transporter permease [Bacilli bacterium]
MNKSRNYRAWLYLAPVLILMGVFTFFPLINTIVISFLRDYNVTTGANKGFTFFNYGVVLGILEKNEGSGFTDNSFISWNSPSALSNTLLITFVTVPISIIISLVIAIEINNIKVLKKFFQTVFFMPYVTNIIAVGLVFSVMFSDGGIFNRLFKLMFNSSISISEGSTSWGASMLVLCLYVIWTALPYKILIFLSGLQGIDKQYYQAAKIDGASRFKTSLRVTIPLLSPQILYITITSFIGAFKEYNAVIGLFNRSYTKDQNVHDLYTVVYYIYDKINGASFATEMQYASAAAVILFVIIMIFTLVQMRVSKKMVVY